MNLELKHLAPYLPYELKVICDYRKEPVEVIGLDLYSIKTGYYANNGNSFDCLNYIGTKPILRTKSDLVKEIPNDIDGRCFYELGTFTKRIGMMSATINIYTENLQYEDFLILVEHHFDVFGLIDAGLAIDINTIK